MSGTILQVSISPGGLPKRAVSEGLITPLGIEGDGHAHPTIHGGPRKAILLISSEMLSGLIARGYPLFFGAMGENLTTEGLDFSAIRLGDQFRAGETILEITQPRGPCLSLDVYGPSLRNEIDDAKVKAGDHTSPRWGLSGFYACVISPGRVRAGDPISHIASLA